MSYRVLIIENDCFRKYSIGQAGTVVSRVILIHEQPGSNPNLVQQCCPTFLYIGAHLTDGCGGAGAVWRLK
jgi:hypothetical protein